MSDLPDYSRWYAPEPTEEQVDAFFKDFIAKTYPGGKFPTFKGKNAVELDHAPEECKAAKDAAELKAKAQLWTEKPLCSLTFDERIQAAAPVKGVRVKPKRVFDWSFPMLSEARHVINLRGLPSSGKERELVFQPVSRWGAAC